MATASESNPQGAMKKKAQPSGRTKTGKRSRGNVIHKELLTVAEAEARKMRAVNPAQYYRQNLGQLGFGDPEHALVQTIKELMDNSLDACEAMGVLPEVSVELTATAKQYEVVTNRTKDGSVRTFPIFRLVVDDNGCGVLRGKVAKCFGSVLYGSKFFSFKQSRGQQGLGVHAAIIYAQLTSLEPAIITTKTESDTSAYRVVMKIDTEKNSPVVIASEEVDFPRPHGTRVELMIAGDYTPKVESFIKELSLANPHSDLKFTVVPGPGQEPKVIQFKRANEILPPPPKEIKPHLLSMEPGALLEMKSNDTCCNTAKQFLVRHFVRISEAKAEELLKASGIPIEAPPKEIEVERLLKSAREGDLMRPPLDVLSPIGEEALRQSIRRMYQDAEFICTASREPWSYRGVPFQIEVGAAYGGQSVIADCERLKDGVFKSRVIRLANKCPLIYDSRDCLLYKVVKEINWRNYKLPQDEGSLPFAPLVLIVSLVSTKVPYSVPGKFAVAYHEEIREQLRLALQTLGRSIQGFISHRQRQEHEQHRQSIFQLYAKEISRDISLLTGTDSSLIFDKLMESIKSKRQKPKPGKEGAPGAETELAATPSSPTQETVEAVAEAPVPLPEPKPKPKRSQFTLEEYLR